MTEKWIKQRRKDRDRQGDQSGMQTETPLDTRERPNPRPRPHEPEPLDGINDREKQHQKKNSDKNQGAHSVKQLFSLDAVCAEEGSAQKVLRSVRHADSAVGS
jgi:hypothetical protein